MDRQAIHGTIREALNLSGRKDLIMQRRKLKNNIILDAEMVAWHGDEIDGT
jgi:hypothetical protein